MEQLHPNENKKLVINVEGENFERWPVRTHVILAEDKMSDVLEKYLTPYLQPGDIIFISEKIVAITQGRAFPIKDIHPSWFSKFLVKFVHKSPYGIGLGSPWTMELALREIGYTRLICAATLAALTKPLGIRGLFYLVAGREVAAIDGPCAYTLPPYNQYAKLGPSKPHKAAKELSKKIGHEVVIIDANDLGVVVLGKSSDKITDKWARAIFKDNPLGQTSEQTPLCIVRKA